MALIDEHLTECQFKERHACAVAAAPKRVIEATAAYKPRSDPVFKALSGLRELPMRVSNRLTGRQGDQPAPFGLHNFAQLGRRDDELLYGLIGLFWKFNYGLRPVANGEAFASFDEAGYAKLALSFSATEWGDGTTRLVTETRVFCPDRATRLKFTPYWLLVRPVSGLIRRRILSSIRTRSEATYPISSSH